MTGKWPGTDGRGLRGACAFGRAHAAAVLCVVALVASSGVRAGNGTSDSPSARGSAAVGAGERWMTERKALVDELRREGIADAAVLRAIGSVPRHEFVPPAARNESYRNHPLPIGEGQTISQPYIVAFMTEALHVGRSSNVLEIGTGSGYQAAVLAEVLGLGPSAAPVVSKPGASNDDTAHGRLASIEIVPALADRAREVLTRLGYRVDLKVGDGYRGWPEKAPFDAIMVTAAPDHVPQPLKEQLAIGGRLIVPVGEGTQQLMVITRTSSGYREETVLPVRFVPMTGEAETR